MLVFNRMHFHIAFHVLFLLIAKVSCEDDDSSVTFTNGLDAVTFYPAEARVERDLSTIEDDIPKCLIRKALDVPESSLTTHYVDEETMEYVRDLCGEGHGRRKRFLTIYPGTKWCGKGDIAKNYNDLGRSKEADRCCRDHDHCMPEIPAESKAYGHYNPMSYTMKTCKCDNAFKACLERADTFTAAAVSKIFFNILGTKCFNY